MPWTPRDARKHTKKATTPKLKRLWAKVANKERVRVGDIRAIRAADSVVARVKGKHRGRLRRV